MEAHLVQVALRHYAELARLGQAFGSPIRLRLLDLLRQAPRSVDALSTAAGLPVANVSQHLQQLRSAHLVESDRHGQRVIYRVANPSISAFFVALRSFSEQLLPELERIKREITTGHRELHPNELSELLEKGRAIVVDVRPKAEYDHAHFDGAISVPFEELADRLEELPNDKIIVTTCRGPYCPLAIAASSYLREAGFETATIDLDGRLAATKTPNTGPSEQSPVSTI
jgi:DNA-binding transcriptional ArsR family regulator/glutaredoxin